MKLLNKLGTLKPPFRISTIFHTMEMRINPDFPKRPDRNKVDALKEIGAATISAELKHIAGIKDSFMMGPKSCALGKTIGGPAITLQFMPIREDYYQDAEEYQNVEEQLHRHALYLAQAGDVVVVDARGDLSSGVFGEMMLAYFHGKGGEGVVLDGCIRDSRIILESGLGIWSRGFTPNYHIQTGIFPFCVNDPISCGGRLVFPGDIIVADDDGAVVVPLKLIDVVLERAGGHKEWEEFSKLKLSEGGDLRKYYPLNEEAQKEYEAWNKNQVKI
jgi:regulator of RNase E activity RraA